MNIFATSNDPEYCAKYLDNKRVVKMVLETCQLLSTAMNICGGIGPYKTTHINHPCSIWVRKSKGNYRWTLEHFEALLKEYTARYGKIHKCTQYIKQFTEGINLIPDGEFTEHTNCTNFKDISDVHLAYQECLKYKWANDIRKPEWR